MFPNCFKCGVDPDDAYFVSEGKGSPPFCISCFIKKEIKDNKKIFRMYSLDDNDNSAVNFTNYYEEKIKDMRKDNEFAKALFLETNIKRMYLINYFFHDSGKSIVKMDENHKKVLCNCDSKAEGIVTNDAKSINACDVCLWHACYKLLTIGDLRYMLFDIEKITEI